MFDKKQLYIGLGASQFQVSIEGLEVCPLWKIRDYTMYQRVPLLVVIS